MIAGIGVDLVKVDRIARSLERYGERFARKILAPGELTAWRCSKTPAMLLAKRFAAKEAVAKALGTGVRGGVHFPQITITHRKSGAPEVILSGKAENRAVFLGVTETHISISDEDEYVVAFVTMECN
ncbi:MAG: holo-ACP synthase [Pseudomonadales bacterium]